MLLLFLNSSQGFGSVAHVQLLVDVVDVASNGMNADVESVGNLLVKVTPG